MFLAKKRTSRLSFDVSIPIMLMVKLRVLKVNPYQNNFYPERNSPHPVFVVKILVAPREMCRDIISYQNKENTLWYPSEKSCEHIILKISGWFYCYWSLWLWVLLNAYPRPEESSHSAAAAGLAMVTMVTTMWGSRLIAKLGPITAISRLGLW